MPSAVGSSTVGSIWLDSRICLSSGHHVLKRPHRFLAPHEQRHDHVREHHDVAQRQHRVALGKGFAHLVSFVWQEGLAPTIGSPDLPLVASISGCAAPTFQQVIASAQMQHDPERGEGQGGPRPRPPAALQLPRTCPTPHDAWSLPRAHRIARRAVAPTPFLAQPLRRRGPSHTRRHRRPTRNDTAFTPHSRRRAPPCHPWSTGQEPDDPTNPP